MERGDTWRSEGVVLNRCVDSEMSAIQNRCEYFVEFTAEGRWKRGKVCLPFDGSKCGGREEDERRVERPAFGKG